MRIALVSVTVLLVACSGAGVPAGLIPPEFRVRQPAGQIGEGRGLVDETSIDLLVDVLNRSSEPITLRRLSLQAVSGGAFGFEPASRTFDETIPPGDRSVPSTCGFAPKPRMYGWTLRIPSRSGGRPFSIRTWGASGACSSNRSRSGWGADQCRGEAASPDGPAPVHSPGGLSGNPSFRLVHHSV